MDTTNPIRTAAAKLGGMTALAVLLNVKPPTVSQWAADVRPVPAHHCPAIESATEGAVMRWHLRPDDWWAIWPELIGRKGAPRIPRRVA